MRCHNDFHFPRRQLLGAAGGLFLGAYSLNRAWAQSDPERSPVAVTNPRAIAGDFAEPAWDEMLTITVGQKDADLVGTTDRVIQAAVDYVTQRGGGTIRILPGTYRLRNAIYLTSRIRIKGDGPDTILIKEPSTATKLALDSDWYDQEITLVDARGFRVGDGVCLRAKNAEHGGEVVIKRTLVARSGNRFKLDRGLRENLWLRGQPTAATLFPLLSGENIAGVVIEDLALDGNRSQNENLDGNYAGCVFLQDCKDVAIRKVTARNNNGDGISWQVCHDVVVEHCHSHDHEGLGLHPGSGSQRPIVRENRVERTQIGIFFCWGVRFGLAENNTIADVRTAGISIGHRDTDNLIRRNSIERSGKVGILFRDEPHAFGPHRNRCENNQIIDSGSDDGVGIDVRGLTEEVTLAQNQVREARKPLSRIGIRIGAQARDITLVNNQIEGYAIKVSDLRTHG
jgi:nitrous oxidase accessory protein NosD